MRATGVRRATDWLLSPTAPSATGGAVALAGLRLLVGLIWLYNLAWKTPSDFGQRGRGGLYHATQIAIEHPVFKPFSWFVQHVVLPHFALFGWLTLAVEAALAVLLLTGTAVRLAALLGVGQSVTIWLTLAEAPGEWPWSYAMLVAIHVVLLFTVSARYAAVDAVRAAGSGTTARLIARRLLGGWGIALGLVGLDVLIRGAQNDQIANVGIKGLEVSLGDYDLLGAVLLAGIAAAMLAAAVFNLRIFAVVAAVLAAVVALSIYLQISKSEVWVGGTITTAVVFMCAAVVALATSLKIGRPKTGRRHRPVKSPEPSAVRSP